MNDVEKRIFRMRISFLRHLTEAMHVYLKDGKEIPEESLEKLNEVANAVYTQHRKSCFSGK